MVEKEKEKENDSKITFLLNCCVSPSQRRRLRTDVYATAQKCPHVNTPKNTKENEWFKPIVCRLEKPILWNCNQSKEKNLKDILFTAIDKS